MPDDYRISDLSTAPSIGNSDLMELSVVNTASETGYTSMKAPVLNLANKIVNATQYVSDLQTQNKTITGAINEIAQGGGGGGGDADIVKTASGNPCSFSTSFASELKSLTADIVCGGGNGSPDSPIPIVGYSELNLTRCGVNLWDEEIEEGYIDNSGNELPSNISARSKNFCACVPNVKYRVYKGYEGGNPPQLCWYDINKNFISRETGAVLTATAPLNAYFFKISMYGMLTSVNHNVGVNYPSTDTEYHAYNGDTFTVQFGQTVYGGMYDKSGRLTITHGYCQVLSTDIVGEYLDTENGQYLARLTPSNPPKRTGSASIAGDVISNILTNKDQGSLYRETGNSVCIMGDADRFRLTFENCDTFEKMQTFLTNNATYLCYELATPIVIDVPSISVFAENGVNNIVSDCLGDVDVEYYTDLAEDIKDFIGDDVEVGDLANVEITTPSNNQVLKYDATSQKWVNGNSSGGSAHNYSTTEQEVGTWIDGSPIYERTVVLTNQATAASLSLLISDTDLLALNIDSANVIGLESIARSVNASPRVEFIDNVYTKGNYESGLTLSFTNGSLYYQCRYSNSAFDFDLYLTFRYTKST